MTCRIYLLRRLIAKYYNWRLSRQGEEVYAYREQNLETILTLQRSKVEELKAKTQFYSTQSLLDRFDPDSAPSSPKVSTPTMARKSLGGGQRLSPGTPRIPYPQHLLSPEQRLRQKESVQSLRARHSLGREDVDRESLETSFTQTVGDVGTVPTILDAGRVSLSPATTHPLPQIAQRAPTFLDRVLELIIGEDETSPAHRYALICQKCFSHNGLAPAGTNDVDAARIKYACPCCGFVNGVDKERSDNISGETSNLATNLEMDTGSTQSNNIPSSRSTPTSTTPDNDSDIEQKILVKARRTPARKASSRLKREA